MASVLSLLPYQTERFDSAHPKTIDLKARQIGISFEEAGRLTFRCLKRREPWYWLHISEDRAKEAIEYVRQFGQACGAVLKTETIPFEGTPDGRALSIDFPGTDARIIGLPSNPRTARGASGNILFDEFAHHLNSEKIWTGAAPIMTRGYQMRIISTPNGKQGKFWELYTKKGKFEAEQFADIRDGWKRFRTDIYEARDQGLPVDIEALRESFTDEEWAQEYCCVFLDEAHAWLPFSLIESAHDPAATLEASNLSGDLFTGIDIGRKRDLTVAWTNERIGDVFITRNVRAMKGAPFSEQKDTIDALIPKCHRTCIDANGIGAQLAEEAEKRWGSRAEGVAMNGQIPAKLATLVKEAFEKQRIRIPDDQDIRRDLHAVRRTYTDAGNVRFEAPRTKDGHADRFWALALALHAASKGAPSMDYRGGESRTRRNMRSGNRRTWNY